MRCLRGLQNKSGQYGKGALTMNSGSWVRTAVHSSGVIIPPPWLSSGLVHREKSLTPSPSTKPPRLTILGAFLAVATQ